MAFAPPPNNAKVPVPAIPANPPTFSDIANSKDYVKRLIHSQASLSRTCATDDEIGAAELYHHQNMLRASLGGPGVPPWLAAITDTLDQIQQNQVRFEQNQARIEQNQMRASAAIDNMRIAKLNVELARNTGITAFHAKQKEVDGDGTILANDTIYHNNQLPLAPLAVTPAVGTVFSPTIDPHNLTHPTILHIIQFYNQDSGIQPGDTVPICSQKIANWLTSSI